MCACDLSIDTCRAVFDLAHHGSLQISKLHRPFGPNPRINIVGLGEAATVTSRPMAVGKGQQKGTKIKKGKITKKPTGYHRNPHGRQ